MVLGSKEALGRSQLEAVDCNWLTDLPAAEGQSFSALAQIRYNSAPLPATVSYKAGRLRVEFDQPAKGVAPGQAVVIYRDQRVLGGGWIC